MRTRTPGGMRDGSGAIRVPIAIPMIVTRPVMFSGSLPRPKADKMFSRIFDYTKDFL